MAFQRKKPAAIGVKAPYPGFIEPELATSVDRVPSGARWIHEIKFDGYRVQVHLRDAVVKVFTRRGNDWTNRFRKIASDAWHINAGSAIIDGEVVVPAADGTTDFSVLQNELKGRSNKIVLVAFDLLYLNGSDLIYAGKVDHGFDSASAKDLQARLKPLIRKTQPYTKKIAHRGVWVEPSLLAEIEYRAKSAEGKVRHPFFKGLREDL